MTRRGYLGRSALAASGREGVSRFVDRGAITAAFVGIGMAVTIGVSFLLVIPIEPIYWALSVPAGLIIGYYADARSGRGRGAWGRILANSLFAGLVTGLTLGALLIGVKALFFAADDGYRDPGSVAGSPVRPAATASISATGRANPMPSPRPASRTPPSFTTFYWAQQWTTATLLFGLSTGFGLAGGVMYGARDPRRPHDVGLPRNRQRPGAAGAFERTLRRRSPPDDADQASFAGAFRATGFFAGFFAACLGSGALAAVALAAVALAAGFVAAAFAGAFVAAVAARLVAAFAAGLAVVGSAAAAAALAAPAAASARLVLDSAARALPAAVWAPFALSALEAAIRAFAAFCAAALPMVFAARDEVVPAPATAAFTVRVRRDLRRAAAFGWIAPTFAARSSALIAWMSAAWASTPSVGAVAAIRAFFTSVFAAERRGPRTSCRRSAVRTRFRPDGDRAPVHFRGVLAKVEPLDAELHVGHARAQGTGRGRGWYQSARISTTGGRPGAQRVLVSRPRRRTWWQRRDPCQTSPDDRNPRGSGRGRLVGRRHPVVVALEPAHRAIVRAGVGDDRRVPRQHPALDRLARRGQQRLPAAGRRHGRHGLFGQHGPAARLSRPRDRARLDRHAHRLDRGRDGRPGLGRPRRGARRPDRDPARPDRPRRRARLDRSTSRGRPPKGGPSGTIDPDDLAIVLPLPIAPEPAAVPLHAREDAAATRRSVLLAVAAAVAFAVGLITSARLGSTPLPWILLVSRFVGMLLIAVPLIARGRLRLSRQALPLVVLSGVLEVVGNGAYVIGAHASPATAAVLGSQFAAIAAVSAYFLFKERLARIQVVGVSVVVLGVTALAIVRA